MYPIRKHSILNFRISNFQLCSIRNFPQKKNSFQLYSILNFPISNFQLYSIRNFPQKKTEI